MNLGKSETVIQGGGGSRPQGKRNARLPFQDHITSFGFKIPVPSSMVIKLLKWSIIMICDPIPKKDP